MSRAWTPGAWRPTYAQTHLPVWHPAREMADREQRQYERGIAEGERAATQRIIEWLRTPIKWTADATEYAERRGMSIEQVEWIMRRTLDTMADALERGEHHE